MTDTKNEKIKSAFARHKVRFVRGQTDFGGTLALLNLATLVGVYWDKIVAIGLNPYLILCGSVATFGIGFWFYGFWYERSGLWKLETTHLNREMNREFLELCSDIGNIKTDLNAIRKWQEAQHENPDVITKVQ